MKFSGTPNVIYKVDDYRWAFDDNDGEFISDDQWRFIEWLDETTPVEKELCVCDFPESGERCTIHPIPDKVEDGKVDKVIEFWDAAVNYCNDNHKGDDKNYADCYESFIAGANWQSTQSDAEKLAETNLAAYDKLWNENEDNKQEVERMKKDWIPRSAAFSIANRFYGSDYNMALSTFDSAAKDLGY